jgi:hypothetical protein
MKMLVENATEGIGQRAAIIVDLTRIRAIVGNVVAELVKLDDSCVRLGAASNLKIAATPPMVKHIKSQVPGGRNFLFYPDAARAVEHCA